MLQPARRKYRKEQKGRNTGLATRGAKVSFGDFGLKATGRGRLTARGIDPRCIETADPVVNLGGARQRVTLKQGLEQSVTKKLIAAIKAAKLKVDTQINGQKLRITGKKRDDLQAAIALLRNTDVELPLQFENFRD